MTLAGAMEQVAALLPGRPEPPVTRYGVMTFAFSQTMRLDRARDLLDWVHAPPCRSDDRPCPAGADRCVKLPSV